jgi:phage shock protein E
MPMADLIPPDHLLRAQGDDAVTVVHVRSPDEYAAGHVPGALNLPIDELEDGLSQLPAGRRVVTYCTMRHPGQSRGERAAARLRTLGWDASALEGGFAAWQAARRHVEVSS